MTFDELCRQVRATPDMRNELLWFLIMLRARAAWEALR
jgi:hypothetical protein